ncbi:MAG: YidC/Oxa1 family insertase periplasmic-domain containing protein, partial [Spirochaetales bacterium]|nr:YidC/Oxa1 family insertase periplasmic-domain containing protein [Spirochaetales bacterium]
TKKWSFYPTEYLFSLTVNLKVLEGEIPELNESGGLYSISTGYELGPVYDKLDNRHDFRKFTIYADQGKGYPKISSSRYLRNDENILWAAVESKYFASICIPTSSILGTEYDKREIDGNQKRHSIRFIRQGADLSETSVSDSYYFYMGPKRRDDLAAYNSIDKNSFNLSGMDFGSLIDPGKLLRPFVKFFGALLRQFYFRLIPNYGIAIIFLAVIIKLLIYPLSKKSIWTNIKIRALQPQLIKIRNEAAGDRGVFKQKQAELYMEEGIRPIMSVLPLILQLFVFVSLYRFLGTDFDMRGAVFIPGIIPDLSLPDTLLVFKNFSVPVLGWKAIRILPFLMLAVIFVQTRITQPPDSGDRGLNRASYFVPILIFMVLYNLPSGVVLYWISQTSVSIVEHFIISKKLEKKK